MFLIENYGGDSPHPPALPHGFIGEIQNKGRKRPSLSGTINAIRTIRLLIYKDFWLSSLGTKKQKIPS